MASITIKELSNKLGLVGLCKNSKILPPSGITSVANVGTGEGILRDIVSNTANLKSLVAGSGVTLTPGANDITIASTGSSTARSALHLTTPLPAQLSIAQLRANRLITLSDTRTLEAAPYVDSADESTFPIGQGGLNINFTVGSYAALGQNPTTRSMSGITLPVSPDPLTATVLAQTINAKYPSVLLATVIGTKVRVTSILTDVVFMRGWGTVTALFGFPSAPQWAENRGACAFQISRQAGLNGFEFGAGGNMTFHTDAVPSASITPGTQMSATTLASYLNGNGAATGCCAYLLANDSGASSERTVMLVRNPGDPAGPVVSRYTDQLIYVSELAAGTTGFSGTTQGTAPGSIISLANGDPSDAGLVVSIAKNIASVNSISLDGANFARAMGFTVSNNLLHFLWDGVSKWYWS